MTLKKLAAFFLAVVMMLCVCALPLMSGAVITTYSGTVSVLPGNTRSKNPTYSYAWLDTVIVRSDASSILPAELIPVDSYPYSLTLDEFISESKQYMVLFDLDVDSVKDTFMQLLQVVYYSVVVLGLTDDYDVMYDYLTEYGIDCTSGDNQELQKMYISVVYSCLKNNAFYALYEKNVTIPRGVSLEHAIVICLAEALQIELPSSVNTLSGLSLLVMRSYVTNTDLPISENPDEYEAAYWAKIAVADAQGYTTPTAAYAATTPAQREYVDYAYCAAIIKLRYDAAISPERLKAAMSSSEDYAVQKLILKTMLDEKGVAYASGDSVQTLFDAACKNGFFALDNEFYTDIYSYNVYADYDCNKVWFSPFALCDQLEGGSLDYLTITVDGTPVKTASTTGVDFAAGKNSQTFVIGVTYNDSGFHRDAATYTFNVFRKTAQETAADKQQSDGTITGSIQSFISTALPKDNVEAQERVSSVFESVNGILDSSTNASGVLTTYGAGTTSTQTTTGSASAFTTYGSESTTEKKSSAVSSPFTTYAPEETKSSAISTAFNTIAKNPVATATPVSLIAIGAALGIILNRKRRENELGDLYEGSNGEGDNESETNDDGEN